MTVSFFPVLGKEKETSLPFLCYLSRIIGLYFSSFREEKTLPYESLWLLSMVMCFPQEMKGNSCSWDICTFSDFLRFALPFSLCVVCSIHTGMSQCVCVGSSVKLRLFSLEEGVELLVSHYLSLAFKTHVTPVEKKKAHTLKSSWFVRTGYAL